MEPERKPDVVDLTKYRKSVAEQAKAQAQAKQKAKAPTTGREPVLGGRQNAGLLLILVMVALAVVFVLPRLMGAH